MIVSLKRSHEVSLLKEKTNLEILLIQSPPTCDSSTI